MIYQGKRVEMRVPADVAARITRVGGRNRFDTPNYRIVWGPDRMEWLGGRFEAEEFGPAHVGLHRVPRYHADRWVLERWMAPETYGTRESWQEQYTKILDGKAIEMLGPFPSTGDYEAVTSFPPVALNSAIVDLLVQVVERSRAASSGDRKEAITGKHEKKQRDWDNHADAVIDDAFPSFHGSPFVHLST